MKITLIIRPLKYYLKQIINILMPGACVLCKNYALSQQRQICANCYIKLPWLGYSCMLCLSPVLKGMNVCSVCLERKQKKIDYMLSPFYYEWPVKQLILKLKYTQDSVAAVLLSRILAEEIMFKYRGKLLPEVIIPVPSSIERAHDLGFNQTIEIAMQVSKKLGIKCDLFMCKKIKNTSRQGKLDRIGRYYNLKNSFTVKNNSYKYVAIVDDVITTGNTVYEVARQLYKSGVQKVDAWGCCKVAC